MMDTRDVISGTIDWHCQQSDAIDFLKSLPNDSIDLLFTSPPYEAARTYGIGFVISGQDWVDWMVEVFKAASPKVKGLIAINCEGQTRDFSYSGVPFLLFADLKRAGFNMRKPPIYQRVGIPGSGGPDWLRNDYEPIICVTRPGKLLWSENTACGSPPVYSVGGRMSNRTTEGERVNGQLRKRKTSQTRRKSNGERLRDGEYQEPDIANPGNIIKCKVGGGLMGHASAHRNEAPFPVDLPAFFVKSFCPPGGIVCDPFAGSSSTGHACLDHGRRYIGCDVRESQVLLSRNRLRNVTPELSGCSTNGV